MSNIKPLVVFAHPEVPSSEYCHHSLVGAEGETIGAVGNVKPPKVEFLHVALGANAVTLGAQDGATSDTANV